MTTTAIYSTTASDDWPIVAEKLYREHNIYPEYWISHDLVDKINKTFQNTTVHDSIDAIQGRFPDEHESRYLYSSLTPDILDQFRHYESTVLKMMDRMDSGNGTGAHFSYPERIRHYHRQLSYWIQLVDDLDPEIVIFGATPHLIYDYILYAVCEQRGIETVIFRHTSLPKRFYVQQEIDEKSAFSENESTSTGISQESKQYLQDLRQNYSKAKPQYMREEVSRNNSLIIKTAKRIKSAGKKVISTANLFSKKSNSYVKIKGKKIERSQMKHWRWNIYRIAAQCYRRKLGQNYQRHETKPDYSSEYIYFPLHYQPERTTSPEGGQYVHQYLAINLLSSTIPSDISVYVKEHPSQFGDRLKGEQGRYSYYYEDLDSISNVNLISLDNNQFNLIDNAKAVATITGTAGWEALVRGTPAITFGNAWYRDAPGCHRVKNQNQLTTVIDNINNNNNIKDKEINEFVSSIESIGYRGSLNSSSKQNPKALYKALCDNCI